MTEVMPKAPPFGDRGMKNDPEDWLRSVGLMPRVPTIRGSDWGTASDPFRYLLVNRYGIRPMLQHSLALAHGDWFHTHMWLQLGGFDVMGSLSGIMEQRIEEIHAVGRARGISADRLGYLEHQERRAQLEAASWVSALEVVPVGESGRSIFQWLGQDFIMDLGGEYSITVPVMDLPLEYLPLGYDYRRHGKLILVLQLDRLIYHEGQKKLYVVDFKTTGARKTSDRAKTIPVEQQFLHNCVLAETLTRSRWLHRQFPDLPKEAEFGGMIHVIVKKPTIKFGMNDRPVVAEEEHTFTRGQRKGETEIRRQYGGEPSIDIYGERCKRWYRAEGEFDSNKVDFRECAPVIRSVVKWPGKGHWVRHEWQARLAHLVDLATRPPKPCNFPMNPSMFGFDRDPYLPFYVGEVADWPQIYYEGGFVQGWRDERLHRKEGITLNPPPFEKINEPQKG